MFCNVRLKQHSCKSHSNYIDMVSRVASCMNATTHRATTTSCSIYMPKTWSIIKIYCKTTQHRGKHWQSTEYLCDGRNQSSDIANLLYLYKLLYSDTFYYINSIKGCLFYLILMVNHRWFHSYSKSHFPPQFAARWTLLPLLN